MRLARGITRTVLITSRWAIKFPSLRTDGDGFTGLLWSICRGILANQCEAAWWGAADWRQRLHLCPVLYSWLGGVVNVYPRAEPFIVNRGVEMAMFRRQFTPVPFLFPQLGDNKPQNYGWLAGRVVALDYDHNYNGCPHDRSGARNGR